MKTRIYESLTTVCSLLIVSSFFVCMGELLLNFRQFHPCASAVGSLAICK